MNAASLGAAATNYGAQHTLGSLGRSLYGAWVGKWRLVYDQMRGAN